MEDKLFYFQPTSTETSLWKNLKQTLSSVVPDWAEKNTVPGAKQVIVPSKSVKLYITLIGGGGSGSLGERRLVNNTLIYARDNNAFNDTTNMLPLPGCGGGGGATIFRLPIIIMKENRTIVNYKVGSGGEGRKNGIGDPIPTKEEIVGKNGEDTSMNILQFDAYNNLVKRFDIKVMGGGGGGAVGYFKSRNDLFNMKGKDVSYIWGWGFGPEYTCGNEVIQSALWTNGDSNHWWRVRGSDNVGDPQYNTTTEVKKLAEWYTELYTRKGFTMVVLHRELDFPIGSENPIDAAENRNEYIPYNLLTHSVDGILRNQILRPSDQVTLLGRRLYAGNPDIQGVFPVPDIVGVTKFDTDRADSRSHNFFYRYAPDDFYYDDTPGIEIDRYMISTLRNHPRMYFIFGNKWLYKDRSIVYPSDSILPTDDDGKEKFTVFNEAGPTDYKLEKHSPEFKELVEKKLGPIYEISQTKGDVGAFGGAGGGFISYYTANPNDRHGLYGGKQVRNPWLLPYSGSGGNPYPRKPLSVVSSKDVQDYIYYYGGKGYDEANSNGGDGKISTYFISGSGGGSLEFIHPTHRLSNRKYDGDTVDFKTTVPSFSEGTYTVANESIYQWYVDNYEKICLGGKIKYDSRNESNPISKLYMNDDYGRHKISFQGREVKDLLKIFGAGGGGGKAFNFTPGHGQENPDLEPEPPGIGSGSGGACSLNEDGEAVVNGLPFGSADYYLRRMLVYREYMMYTGFFFESWLGCVLTYFAVLTTIIVTGIAIEALTAILTGGTSVAASIAAKSTAYAAKGSVIMSKLASAFSKFLIALKFILELPKKIFGFILSVIGGLGKFILKGLNKILRLIPFVGKFLDLIAAKFNKLIAWFQKPGIIAAKMAQKGSKMGKFLRGVQTLFRGLEKGAKKILALLSGDILDFLGVSDDLTKAGAKMGANIATEVFSKGAKLAKGIQEGSEAAIDITKQLANAIEEGRKIGMESLNIAAKTVDDIGKEIKNVLDVDAAKDAQQTATKMFDDVFKNADDMNDANKVSKFMNDLELLDGVNPKTKAKILEFAGEQAENMIKGSKQVAEEAGTIAKTASKEGSQFAAKVGSEATKVAQEGASKFAVAAKDLGETIQKQAEFFDIIVTNASPETLSKMFTKEMTNYVKMLPEQTRASLMSFMKEAIGSNTFKYFENAGEMLENLTKELRDPSMITTFSNKFIGEMTQGIEDTARGIEDAIKEGNKYVAKFTKKSEIYDNLGEIIAKNPAVEEAMKTSDELKATILRIKTANPSKFNDFDLAKHVVDNPSYNKAMTLMIFRGDVKNLASNLDNLAKSDPQNVAKMLENLKGDPDFVKFFAKDPSKIDDLKPLLSNIQNGEQMIGAHKAKLLNELSNASDMPSMVKGLNKGDITRLRQLALDGKGSKFLDDFNKWSSNSSYKTVLEDGKVKVFINDTDVTEVIDELVAARSSDNFASKADDALGITEVDKPPSYDNVKFGDDVGKVVDDPLMSSRIANLSDETKPQVLEDLNKHLLKEQRGLLDQIEFYDTKIQEAAEKGQDTSTLVQRKSNVLALRQERIDLLKDSISKVQNYTPPPSVKVVNNPSVSSPKIFAQELNELGITKDLTQEKLVDSFAKGDSQYMKGVSDTAQNRVDDLGKQMDEVSDEIGSTQSKLEEAIARKKTEAIGQPDLTLQQKIELNNQQILIKEAELATLKQQSQNAENRVKNFKYAIVEPDGTVKFNDSAFNAEKSRYASSTPFDAVDNKSVSKASEVQNTTKVSGAKNPTQNFSDESKKYLRDLFPSSKSDQIPLSNKTAATQAPTTTSSSKNVTSFTASLNNKGNTKFIDKSQINFESTPSQKQRYIEDFKKAQSRFNETQEQIASLENEIRSLEVQNLQNKWATEQLATSNASIQKALDDEIDILSKRIRDMEAEKLSLNQTRNKVQDVKNYFDEVIADYAKRPLPPIEPLPNRPLPLPPIPPNPNILPTIPPNPRALANVQVAPGATNKLIFQVDNYAVELTTNKAIRGPIISTKMVDLIYTQGKQSAYYAYVFTMKTLFVLNSYYNTDSFTKDIQIQYQESNGVNKTLNQNLLLGPNVGSNTFKNIIVKELLESKPETCSPERLNAYANIYNQLFDTPVKITKSQIDNQMIDDLMESKKYGLAIDLNYVQNFIQYENLNIINKVNYKYLFNIFTDVDSLLKSQISYIIRNPIMFV